MLQEIQMARLTTEAATLRCFMAGSRGTVCPEPQDSAASERYVFGVQCLFALRVPFVSRVTVLTIQPIRISHMRDRNVAPR